MSRYYTAKNVYYSYRVTTNTKFTNTCSVSSVKLLQALACGSSGGYHARLDFAKETWVAFTAEVDRNIFKQIANSKLIQKAACLMRILLTSNNSLAIRIYVWACGHCGHLALKAVEFSFLEQTSDIAIL